MRLALLILVWCITSHAQTADKAFWTITAIHASATSLDAYTTVTRIGHTQTCPEEVWSAPLYGKHPEAARTSMVMGGLFSASVLLSYSLKKHHAHLKRLPVWAAPQAYLTYGHTLGAIHNFRFCH